MKSLFFLTMTALTAISAPPEPIFSAQEIDRSVKIGYGTAIADVDGDKRPDILLADARQIRWYKNPGKRGVDWPRYVLAEELTKFDNVCIAAQDIDGDGKCEVAVGAEWNPGDTVKSGAVFYLIPPEDRTQKWDAVKFPAVEPTTHRMRWVRTGPKEWGLLVLPLHGRGNKNGEGAPVKVLVYRKPDDVRTEWKSEVVNESMHATHNFDVRPKEAFDTGRELASLSFIFLGGREGLSVVGKGSENGWEAFPMIAAEAEYCKGVGEVRIGTLKPTFERPFVSAVEPMHGNELVVYFRSEKQPALTRKVLTNKLSQGHALACADVLGIGSEQIIVGWRGNIPPKEGDTVGVAVWTALDGNGEQWRETVIDDSTACEDLAVADLDADGKPDIVAAGRASHNLRIHWNSR
jgi:hypothetical protein